MHLFSRAAWLGAALLLVAFFGNTHALKAAGEASFTVRVSASAACFDGLDNDSDGFTDYPDDVDCTSTADTDEAAPASAGPAPSGGGGGGGFLIEPSTSVSFAGRAYPGSAVTLLKDGLPAVSVTAGSDALFEVHLTGLNAGNYLFLLYAESTEGRRSSMNPFQISLPKGAIVNVSDIMITPTFQRDYVEVKPGTPFTIFGDASPNATLIFELTPSMLPFQAARATAAGKYQYSIDTTTLVPGMYQLKMRATVGDKLTSAYSSTIQFEIGDKNVPVDETVRTRADMNGDGRVNLLDFSIVAYWYRRTLTGSALDWEVRQLNGDGKIDLVDFSIMAFNWTG